MLELSIESTQNIIDSLQPADEDEETAEVLEGSCFC